MKSKTTIFVCLLILGGCQINTYTETVPLDGYLATPNGNFEFEQVSSEEDKEKFRVNPTLKPFSTITAGNDISRVIFTPFSPVSTIKFVSIDNKAIFSIDTEEAFYQIGDGQKIKWNLPIGNHPIKIGFFLYSENSTPYYYIKLDIPPIDFKKNSSDRVRYHIPYTLDGNKHVMDVEIEIKKNRELKFGLRGIPGMP